MQKQDLIDRSPVRFLEKATNGGLQEGEVAIITSKKGLGKTSVLVQIGLDALFQDKNVVHVSFNQQSDFVMTWYEDIFTEMAKKKNLQLAKGIKSDIVKNRVILNFNQDAFTISSIVSTLKALEVGGVKTDSLIIDGLSKTKLTAAAMDELKTYAKEAKVSIWFSQNTEGETLETVLPQEISAKADAIVHLSQKPDTIQMEVLKVRNETISDSNLRLDSKTLLMFEK
jgi:KaiC/GvpD/RAD55 family RecA-like ATPase